MIEVLMLTACLSQFCDSCQPCSPPVYYQPPRQNYNYNTATNAIRNGITRELRNVPSPEVSREIVTVRLENNYFSVPVINGFSPSITMMDGEEPYLILDYRKRNVFNRELYKTRAYIAYSWVDERATPLYDTRNPKRTNTQEGVRRPSDDEIDNLLNGTGTKLVTPLKENTSVLKKPSAVDNLNDNSILPRY